MIDIGTILVIEDDLESFDLIKRLLFNYFTHPDLKVLHATDLEKAKDFIKGELIDIAVVDFYLEAESGLNIFPENTDQISFPVIILSAASSFNLAVQSFKMGVKDYIDKVKIETLPNEIEKVVSQWRLDKAKLEKDYILRNVDDIETLALSITHNIKEPLVKISRNIDELKENKFEDIILFDHKIEIISTTCDLLLNRIAELAKLIQIGSLPLSSERLSIDEIIVNVKLALDSLLNSLPNLKFEIEGTSSLVFIGYRTHLTNLFQNIIHNSLKFIGEANRNPQINIKCTSDEKFIYVSISDNGIGIPINLLSLTFKPFFKANKQTDGSGIGLAISKKIVEMHKGNIQFEQSPLLGTGSTISLSLFRNL